MQWIIMLLMAIVAPVVQPAVQQGVQQVQQNVQQRVQQRMQQAQQKPASTAEQVPQYYFDGREWYCHCNGQWYVWRRN
jgi:type II secretory pathway pseudopilin PulG